MTQPVKLKALSIRQPFAEEILLGEKTEEIRSWAPAYRGPILVHASKSKEEEGHEGLPLGCLVGIVEFWQLMIDEAEQLAYWQLREPRRFREPIPYTGRVGLMLVPLDLVADVELLLPDGTPAGETLAAYLASTGLVVA